MTGPNTTGPKDDGPVHYLVDGAVLHRDDPALDADALLLGRCYTSARVRAGRARWSDRHAARLARDAHSLGLEPPDPSDVAAAFEALARAEFGDGEGVVRLQLGPGAAGTTRLVGVPRAVGIEPDTWRMGRAPVVHAGPGGRGQAKLLGVPFIEAARSWLAEAACEEAALFDERGRLVEGTRSNLVVVTRDGSVVHPAPELGPVAGIALEVARELWPALAPRLEITTRDLDEAREIIALNAVRGARPVTRWGERRVGDGRPGPVAQRLAEALDRT